MGMNWPSKQDTGNNRPKTLSHLSAHVVNPLLRENQNFNGKKKKKKNVLKM